MMRLFAILIGLTPVVVFEIGLRWFAPVELAGTNLDRAIDYSQLRPLFRLSDDDESWEIPPERFNFFRPASFKAVKPAGTRRIFVLGGSTTAGRPYETETAFAKWLEIKLQAADQQHRYEVVNCGGVSYASYRVQRILDEVLEHEPDAIVIYTGHNEFLEARTYASMQDRGVVRRAIDRVGVHLHMVRWLRLLFFSNEPRAAEDVSESTKTDQVTLSSEVDTRLDHRGGLESYRRDARWRDAVHQHFAETIRRMTAKVRTAQIPLVVCTPASDLVGTPPFKSTLPDNVSEAHRQQFLSAWDLATQTDVSIGDQIGALEECFAIDPQNANASFAIGRLLWDDTKAASAAVRQSSLKSDSARLWLTRARDQDVCPLRATSKICSTVQDLSEQGGDRFRVIDTSAVLDLKRRQDHVSEIDNGFKDRFAGKGDGIADPSFFVDHVHPTVAGHQRIAAAIADAFADFGWVRFDNDSSERYRVMSEKHLSGLNEAYFQRAKQRLSGLRRWTEGRAAELGVSK